MAPSFQSILGKILQRKGLKFLALFLATATWLYIRETTSFEDVVSDVPVEVVVPEGWAIQERSVNTVEVTFRGSQSDIRNLNKSQIRVQVDARGKEVQPQTIVQLDRSNVSAPRAVRAMFVDPSEISLTLDREADKTVPIKVDQLGQPPEGYDIESIVVTPPTVTLHGPERRLAGVESVRTAPIEMEGRIRSFQVNRALITPGENWQARMDIDRVRLEYTIVERSVRRDFTNIAVKALLPPGVVRDVSFAPEFVSISLRGRTDVITNLTRSVIHAFVDCSEVKPGESEDRFVEVPAPAGVSIIAIEPQSVRVEMEGAGK
jgi:YbbR domain-containing protein